MGRPLWLLLALVGCVSPETPSDSDTDGTSDTEALSDTEAQTSDTEDCVPQTWYADADEDGYGDPEVSESSCEAPSGMVDNALDCNDADDTVHPGAEELTDGIDNDCDGPCDEDAIGEGSLVLTEFHPAPSVGQDGEFIEVFNTEDFDIYACDSLSVRSDSSEQAVLGDVVFPAGEYTVVAMESDTSLNGGVSVDVALDASSALTLEESDDALALWLEDSVRIDGVEYDADWPVEEGASVQLDPSYVSGVFNDDADYWCASTESYGDGDLGTPGEANSVCDAHVYASVAGVWYGPLEQEGFETWWTTMTLEQGGGVGDVIGGTSYTLGDDTDVACTGDLLRTEETDAGVWVVAEVITDNPSGQCVDGFWNIEQVAEEEITVSWTWKVGGEAQIDGSLELQ